MDQAKMAKSLEHFRKSDDYLALKLFLQSRLEQHFMSIVSASEEDFHRLQGACQEIFAIFAEINDASLVSEEMMRSLSERAIAERERAPLLERQRAEYLRASRFEDRGVGGHGWDPRVYRGGI